MYWRCKCGNSTAMGSMPPDRCATCDECGSDLASSPEGHREPTSHDFSRVSPIDTDQGPATVTRCRYCRLTQAQINQRRPVNP